MTIDVQEIMIHENETVQMVHRKYSDVEVYYDKQTGEGTIFWNDLEIECRVTGAVMLMLCRINKKDCDFFEKVAILQEIERMNRTLKKILSLN